MAGIECEEKPIGEGSFGSVYVATRTAPGSGDVERVAVKRLLPSVAPHRVLNELEQLARSAEGAGYAVPALLDAYRDPGGFVVVMEYFAHDDWKAYYDQLTWHEVGQYMRELLAALAHVHARGVVHRDVKPRNFLFDRRTGRGCLVDFGLAQSCDLWEQRRRHLAKQAVAECRDGKEELHETARR